MDLFAGGGGNFSAETQGNYQNLIYINDGKGQLHTETRVIAAQQYQLRSQRWCIW